MEERNAEEKRFKLASITNLKFQITYLSAMKKELSQGGRKVKSIQNQIETFKNKHKDSKVKTYIIFINTNHIQRENLVDISRKFG